MSDFYPVTCFVSETILQCNISINMMTRIRLYLWLTYYFTVKLLFCKNPPTPITLLAKGVWPKVCKDYKETWRPGGASHRWGIRVSTFYCLRILLGFTRQRSTHLWINKVQISSLCPLTQVLTACQIELEKSLDSFFHFSFHLVSFDFVVSQV